MPEKQFIFFSFGLVKNIFSFLNQNICYGYSKEPSQWDGSFEHPKQTLKLTDKQIFSILHKIFTYTCHYNYYSQHISICSNKSACLSDVNSLSHFGHFKISTWRCAGTSLINEELCSWILSFNDLLLGEVVSTFWPVGLIGSLNEDNDLREQNLSSLSLELIEFLLSWSPSVGIFIRLKPDWRSEPVPSITLYRSLS